MFRMLNRLVSRAQSRCCGVSGASTRISPVLGAATTIRDSTVPLYEGMEMSVQVLAHPEVLGLDDVLIVVRWWDQGRWEYSDVREVIVKTTDKLKVLTERVP